MKDQSKQGALTFLYNFDSFQQQADVSSSLYAAHVPVQILLLEFPITHQIQL